MVHWVYVLSCDDDYIYVGETTKLYGRFSQHINRRGANCTSDHTPRSLMGLYRVNENYSFLRYRNSIRNDEYNKFIIENWSKDEGDNLEIENLITRRHFYQHGDDWQNVYGGKYCGRRPMNNPIKNMDVKDVVDRPLCKCGQPCEVKLSRDKTKIYFVCSLANITDDWRNNFFSGLDVDSPCDFWQAYTDDKLVKERYERGLNKLREPWFQFVPGAGVMSLFPCVLCEKDMYDPVFAFGRRRSVCQKCLAMRYPELKAKYEIDHKEHVRKILSEE